VRPTSETANQLTYRLTPEVIQAIFVEHPAVLAAYRAVVPHRRSEKDFWLAFLRSRYFHRDRRRQDTSMTDLFDEFVQEEEQQLADTLEVRKRKTRVNMEVDLPRNLGENTSGYGAMLDGSLQPYSLDPAIALIRRFNRHSELVLAPREEPIADLSRPLLAPPAGAPAKIGARSTSSSSSSARSSASPSSSSSSASSASASASVDAHSNSPTSVGRRRANSGLALPNVRLTTSGSSAAWEQRRVSKRTRYTDAALLDGQLRTTEDMLPLDLEHSPGLFTGSDAAEVTGQSGNGRTATAARAHDQGVANWSRELLDGWSTHSELTLPSSEDVELTRLLARAGYLTEEAENRSIEEVLSLEVRQQLHGMVLRSYELLRHFWACYPVLDRVVMSRAYHLNLAISKLYDQLEELPRAASEQTRRNKLHSLVRPVLNSLEKATTHYEVNNRQEASPSRNTATALSSSGGFKGITFAFAKS
jgi:transcription initiation factor TFIIH subunit 1